MRSRRILYALALLAALLFQIFYDRYLARFVLACVISLPPLSLLISLPAALRLRLRLEGDGAEYRRGAAGAWKLSTKRQSLLPVPLLKLRLLFSNDLTGWTEKKRVIWSGDPLAFPVQAEHCGRATCRVTCARMVDCLGLFALPVRRPAPAAVLVLPTPAPPEDLPDLNSLNESAAEEGKQRIPNGEYELRDYRVGDPLRSIHWKLSSKRDELIVREWQGSAAPKVLLVVDRCGDPERLDRVLDRLYGLSRSLLERDSPHLVRWEEQGTVCTVSVSDQESLLSCMGALLSSRAPLQGGSLQELAFSEGKIPVVCVTAGEEDLL